MRRYKAYEQRDHCYDFPMGHLGHMRTISPVRSPFAVLRPRIDLVNQYKKVD